MADLVVQLLVAAVLLAVTAVMLVIKIVQHEMTKSELARLREQVAGLQGNPVPGVSSGQQATPE